MTSGPIATIPMDDLRGLITKHHPAIWVGTVSFEERCIGSLAALHRSNLQLQRAVAFNYTSQVRPATEDERRRMASWDKLRQYAETVCIDGIEQIKIDPYSFQSFQESIKAVVQAVDFKLAIFDVSCMTKIDGLALAALLSEWAGGPRWVVAYSVPENYGNLGEMHKAAGWRDIIIAPLAETAVLFNETGSRGIIIPGHEADRLIVALAELEPAGGVILFAKTEKRPDLRYLSERLNGKIVRQLTRMRSMNWTKEIVGLTDSRKLQRSVAREVQMARESDAPVILFPYGPKSLVFLTALQLAAEYPSASWFVYPIPTSYDVNYSEGIEQTVWLGPQAILKEVMP